MSTRAAIKGSVVANHAEVLKKYLDQHHPEEALLERHFEAGELDTLMDRIDPTAWYDIEMYRRLLEFLRDHDGGGSNAYLEEGGRRSAENLIRAGIHAQFEYLRRTQHADKISAEERSGAFGRDLRLLSTISASILNFTESSVIPDPDRPLRWIIQNDATHPYPEVLCWTAQGFSNRMAEEHGAGRQLWSWKRRSPTLVQFHMCRDI